jgi:succinyl-CoA synthetase alpha subunit
MAIALTIRKNQYYDSVFLMRINNQISAFEGVLNSAVVMGTDNNKKILSGIGVDEHQIKDAAPNDLIVVVIADNADIAGDILDDLDNLFDSGREQTNGLQLKSIKDGLLYKPEANLVVISVPGTYAFREAKTALDNEKNVFLFSDNVSISDESALKKYADANGLLVMGPDCGTSIIGGVGIGFANKVRQGSIGVVGASGTGLQEFTCQIHNAGFGISHALGTGSRDLSNEIGGISTLAGLKALGKDPNTRVIAVISKPPGIKTLKRLSEFVNSIHKPVIACFLGLNPEFYHRNHNFIPVRTVDEAVRSALSAVGETSADPELRLSGEELKLLETEKRKIVPSQKYVRGMFAGGTFCYQAQQIFQNSGLPVYSNTPIIKENNLSDSDISKENTMIDMGDDRYTVDKPHPMIDGTHRCRRILEESKDPLVAVLLIDIILGYNASPDPVGDILEAVIEAKQLAFNRGEYLCTVASVCGTDEDFQDKALQVEMAEQAGVIVFNSNAKAALFCSGLLL